jgi:uroporphyrinogen-III decarboxylase
MTYYLNHYLGGMDEWQAFEKFDMDFAIYRSPIYLYDESYKKNWLVERRDLGVNADGDQCWEQTITTPEGKLHESGAYNEITGWETECLLKSPEDFEIWNKYRPIPVGVDLSPIKEARDRLGDRGIIRSHPFSPGQGSPWQSFCILYGTEPAIMLAMDNPSFLHHALKEILKRTLEVTAMWEGTPADMVETGGGAGSSTVISPSMSREFCVPYEQEQVKAFHAVGLKVVYHLCGGLMPMLDLVVETGADGLETMTPPDMGGDCDLAKASAQVGDKLFFIGGFDQNKGFENGTPEAARRLVFECFEATKDHAGYICCPSDHFFHGAPENIEAFVKAVKECVY